MGNDWYARFKKENNYLLEKLKSGNEMERLFALAKLEEKCYGNGVSEFLVDTFLEHAQNDESSIVRAFALRSLYHQSSETWPMGPDERKKILTVINEKRSSEKYDVDSFIASELSEIESGVKWLSDHLYWKNRRH